MPGIYRVNCLLQHISKITTFPSRTCLFEEADSLSEQVGPSFSVSGQTVEGEGVKREFQEKEVSGEKTVVRGTNIWTKGFLGSCCVPSSQERASRRKHPSVLI